ncbi:protein kinase [Nannocystis pusilla]|uniref:Protein kinase n=1 Tax=Nannocystis pusilla TaxID=889268 RepID=A0A9X3EH94_9BACT|nr:protein kinase [Nannocystis pusilla]
MTEPPPQVPDDDGNVADARTREVPPDPPVVQARPGRTRSHPRVPDEPPAPTRIRHFTVLRQIGQGGMGVVLSAFDDELDRKVAIKLMRPSHGDSLGRARLQREAQAMAKLAHPNIARVYEVGEFEGRVYIVMEYVQGETLRAWLRRGPHPWRDVSAILQQAGRGLAVAHAAGLVHRDFKPDNVMVAEDGFVRVLDFGLARAVEAGEANFGADPRLFAPVTHSTGSLSEPLTEAGTLVGTPPYMSPEQFALQPIGVESDQFSFCVVLYEGLHGARPFKARTADELLTQIEALQRSEPPRGPKSRRACAGSSCAACRRARRTAGRRWRRCSPSSRASRASAPASGSPASASPASRRASATASPHPPRPRRTSARTRRPASPGCGTTRARPSSARPCAPPGRPAPTTSPAASRPASTPTPPNGSPCTPPPARPPTCAANNPRSCSTAAWSA